MKKVISNFFVILISAPIVAFTAIVGGLVSGLYYGLFYVYTKMVVQKQKNMIPERAVYFRQEEDNQ